MAGNLAEPLLFSKLAHFDHITIAGQTLEVRHIFFTWLGMILLCLFSLAVRRKLTTIPGGLQNACEVFIDGLENFTVDNLGEDGRKVFPMLCGGFIFVLVMNLLGLVPGCDAPTANINTNIALALSVFFYYNYHGIKRWHGHYIHHFLGPSLPLAPLMLVLEIISHLARPLSMSLRLFGNIRGEEIVIVLFFLMAPIIGTIPIFYLFILAKVMQAFIFYMLTMLYLKGALEPAH